MLSRWRVIGEGAEEVGPREGVECEVGEEL